MELLITIAILVIGYSVVKSFSQSNDITSSSNSLKKSTMLKNEVIIRNNEKWLDDRWRLSEEHKLTGNYTIFPEWFFDEVTDSQLERLEKNGIEVSSKITKGQASDLIGMFIPADEEDLGILKFFKIPTRGMKQTHVRHEVALILQDGEKVQAWKARPPSAIQKEFFKFFGLKLAKGTTNEQAAILISEHETEKSDINDPKLKEWEAYEQIIDELSDSDFREDYEIKKPSATLIKQAIVELQKEGKSYQDISNEIDILVEKLIELKPELERG